MNQIERDELIDTSLNVLRLSDYRPVSDFDTRLMEIARMFIAQRAAERALSLSYRNRRSEPNPFLPQRTLRQDRIVASINEGALLSG
jgi:hypothetical protein